MSKLLLNYIELAYAPISNYDFSIIKMDSVISEFINKGKIYVIVQRPVLTIENFTINDRDTKNPIAEFEIHQKGNDNRLRASMPLYQEIFGASQDSRLDIGFTYAYPKPTKIENKLPATGLANFSLKTQRNMVIWLSPEKFLYHHIRGALDCDVSGDITDFLKYQVHYVGKATEQNIVRRLTGHSHLQDILSLEHPLKHGSLPTDEIAILVFRFKDNLHIMNNIGPDNFSDAVNVLSGSLRGNYPVDQRNIYLDAEKALIKVLKPKHNRQLYSKYPKSKDGLANYKFDLTSYTFLDPITLMYNDGELTGASAKYTGDQILIRQGNVEVTKGGSPEES